MENALGISGPQAVMMAITASFTVLGLMMLLAAVLMKKRWRPSYTFELGFIALMKAWLVVQGDGPTAALTNNGETADVGA